MLNLIKADKGDDIYNGIWDQVTSPWVLIAQY